ncbi:MAG: hypothetical protein ACR2PT_11080 [Endozoicomonas sp.]
MASQAKVTQKKSKHYTQRLYPLLNLLAVRNIYSYLENEEGCINIKDGTFTEFHASNQVLATVANLGDRAAEIIKDYNLTVLDPSLDTANYATLLGGSIAFYMEDSNIDKKAVSFDDTVTMYLFKVSANHYTRYFKGFFKDNVFYWVEDPDIKSKLSQLGTAAVMSSGYVGKSVYYVATNVKPTANMFRDMLADQGFSSATSVVRGMWVPKVKAEAPPEQQWVAAGKEALAGSGFLGFSFIFQLTVDSGFVAVIDSPAHKILTTTYTHIAKCSAYAFHDSAEYALKALGIDTILRTIVMAGMLMVVGGVMHNKANAGIGTGVRNGLTFKGTESLVLLTGLTLENLLPEEPLEHIIDSTVDTAAVIFFDLPVATARVAVTALSSLPAFGMSLAKAIRTYMIEPETYSCMAIPARGTATDVYQFECIGEKTPEVAW